MWLPMTTANNRNTYHIAYIFAHMTNYDSCHNALSSYDVLFTRTQMASLHNISRWGSGKTIQP